MRTIAAVIVTLQGMALWLLFTHQASPEALALALALLLLCALVATVKGRWPLVTNVVVAALLFGFAADLLVAQPHWLDGPPRYLTWLMAAVPVAVAAYLGRRLKPVWKDEMVVLRSPLFGTQVIKGAAQLLPTPFSTVRARLPLGLLKVKVAVEHVNTRPRAGPLAPFTQNVRLLELDVKLKLLPQAYPKLFTMPNKAELFDATAAALHKERFEAQQDPRFWIAVVGRLVQMLAGPLVRDEVLCIDALPQSLLEHREQLRLGVMERLKEELLELGIALVDCSILRIELDEHEAALQSRVAVLMAQSRAAELHLAGEAASIVYERMAGVSREHDLPLPLPLLEALLHGVLPNSAPVMRIRSEPGPDDRTWASPDQRLRPGTATPTRLDDHRDRTDRQAA